MQALVGILAVTFPFFALVLCGYLAARSRLLPLDAVAGLNMFVLYFALPCMLFRFGGTTPAAQLFHPVIALLWLAVAATVVAATAGWARRHGARWPDAAMGALVAAFPNSGFMGVPLILALLGPGAVGPVMATLLVDLAVTTSLCIGLSQWGAAGEHGPAKAVASALRGVLRNPMPWSILLGALSGIWGLTPWAPLGKTVQLLADAASPVALFTIGAVLARSRMRPAAAADGAAPPRDVAVLVAAKLLLHPLLVWGMGLLAVRAGALTAPALASLVLVAALPAASNVSLLAERFGADNGRVARVILWSTALAFFSFSAAVAWLR
ncbi:AEC family transporter [Ottowia testudinis]|uniref:AEC family transporter n=1 Tax=Ottowia testudinis TaxID=2816950 RepID=A0A975H426_9BURK|nr:AEC family transporter [Ottowia testudinis]QTD45915.1 AEC family transporter [Ottowia testudinis]